MRFVMVHKVATYLMVSTGLAMVSLPGDLHPLFAIAAPLAIVLSWFRAAPVAPDEPDPSAAARPARVGTRLWNIASLVILARTVYIAFVEGAFLIPGTEMVVFLAIQKLFTRDSVQDHLQLYALSFLHLVAGTVINDDVLFGPLFLLYIVFSTWSLILFQLKREMEENFLLKYGESLEGRPVQVQRVLNSRRLVGKPFLAITAAVAVLVFLGALTVFFLFPRVGFGFFFSKQRGGVQMAGFSDNVELGRFGTIRDDPTVVMRVEFDRPEGRDALPLYWRGITFDHYDGKRWTKTAADRARGIRREGDWRVLNPASGELVEYSVYLEPMEIRVLFTLTLPHALSLVDGKRSPMVDRRPAVGRDRHGDLYYSQFDQVAFRYRARSMREPAHIAELGMSLEEYRADVASRPEAPQPRRHVSSTRERERPNYLQVPDDLDPRVPALAAEIIGDAATVGEAISRVERHLLSEYTYTLTLKRDLREAPLSDFLFVQRQGHCEYFATAMVILLRTQGILARSVNGFHGGTWNGFGNFLAVAQGDAHSWVEVGLGDGRWITRDPTPSAARRGNTGLWAWLAEVTDAARLRWYKYIIEYDLGSQLGALRSLRDLTGSRGETAPAAAGRRVGSSLGPALGVLTALFAAVLLIRARRHRDRISGATDRPQLTAVVALLESLFARYAHLGHPRRASATAREHLSALRGAAAPDLGVAEAVVDLYEAVRFADQPLDEDALRDLARRIPRIGDPPRP